MNTKNRILLYRIVGRKKLVARFNDWWTAVIYCKKYNLGDEHILIERGIYKEKEQ